jgi:spectinomycin phosphotransferase
MLEPPRLAEAEITGALRAHYGISTTELTFLPLGNDYASWVYRVQTNEGQILFLKVRAREGFSASSLVVPHYLQERGVPHIVAPLPTIAQTLWVSLNDFALSLYPFIDGQVGADRGLSEQQWRMFGALLRQIHACLLPPKLLQLVSRESFIPSRRLVISDLKAAIRQQTFTDPVERELALFWHERKDDIRVLVKRAGTLGRHLQRASGPRVLCHADMHTWNVLLDSNQQLWLIDWDEVVLALKERDLMFVVGGIGGDRVGRRETAWFLQGYGDSAIDPGALTYYRFAWAVQDMAAYGERVFSSQNLSEDARRAALQGFIGLFEPGNIVPLALASNSDRV